MTRYQFVGIETLSLREAISCIEIVAELVDRSGFPWIAKDSPSSSRLAVVTRAQLHRSTYPGRTRVILFPVRRAVPPRLSRTMDLSRDTIVEAIGFTYRRFRCVTLGLSSWFVGFVSISPGTGWGRARGRRNYFFFFICSRGCSGWFTGVWGAFLGTKIYRGRCWNRNVSSFTGRIWKIIKTLKNSGMKLYC